MIRRFLTLLLVFLMLANHGLCLAHVHHGSDFAEPEDHGSRPHIHVAGHAHHDWAHDHRQADQSQPNHSDSVPHSGERDTTLPPASPTGGEHDSNAVYLGGSVAIASSGSSANILPERDVVGPASLQVGIQTDGMRQIGPSRGQPPSVFAAACPIYLRKLSLRL